MKFEKISDKSDGYNNIEFENRLFPLVRKIGDSFKEYADKWYLIEVENPFHEIPDDNKVPYSVKHFEGTILLTIVFVNLFGYEYAEIKDERRPDNGMKLSIDFSDDMEKYLDEMTHDHNLKGDIYLTPGDACFYIEFDKWEKLD